jgi:hypothetical protein
VASVFLLSGELSEFDRFNPGENGKFNPGCSGVCKNCDDNRLVRTGGGGVEGRFVVEFTTVMVYCWFGGGKQVNLFCTTQGRWKAIMAII